MPGYYDLFPRRFDFLSPSVLSGSPEGRLCAATKESDDEIVLEWWKGEKKLAIYASPGAIEYVKVWGPDIFSEMEDGNIENAQDFQSLWRWLTA